MRSAEDLIFHHTAHLLTSLLRPYHQYPCAAVPESASLAIAAVMPRAFSLTVKSRRNMGTSG
jgi:hypothetical protein